MKKKVLSRSITALVLIGAVFFVHSQKGREVPTFSPLESTHSTLIIDAGHGGEDGGAVSASGTVESHINLAVALRLKAFSDLLGTNAILLRDSDISLHDSGCETLRQKKVSDLRNRVEAIENTPNAVLMSIHQNTFQNPKYSGAQVFFGTNPDSLSFAEITQSTLKSLNPQNVRIPAQIPSSVYLMNHISCPAILVECGFLSNPDEDALLQTPEYQTKLAMAMAGAYITYSQQNLHEGETLK